MTIMSNGGLQFGILEIISSFGNVWADQSYWQVHGHTSVSNPVTLHSVVLICSACSQSAAVSLVIFGWVTVTGCGSCIGTFSCL